MTWSRQPDRIIHIDPVLELLIALAIVNGRIRQRPEWAEYPLPEETSCLG